MRLSTTQNIEREVMNNIRDILDIPKMHFHIPKDFKRNSPSHYSKKSKKSSLNSDRHLSFHSAKRPSVQTSSIEKCYNKILNTSATDDKENGIHKLFHARKREILLSLPENPQSSIAKYRLETMKTQKDSQRISLNFSRISLKPSIIRQKTKN